jgi:hypothetical protein
MIAPGLCPGADEQRGLCPRNCGGNKRSSSRPCGAEPSGRRGGGSLRLEIIEQALPVTRPGAEPRDDQEQEGRIQGDVKQIQARQSVTPVMRRMRAEKAAYGKKIIDFPLKDD